MRFINSGFFVLFLILSVLTADISGALPGVISFQGKLTDADNNSVNGSYDFKFTLYDNATSDSEVYKIWTETQYGIAVSNGLYSVELGRANPELSAITFNAPYWLQVEVSPAGLGSYETFSPRHRLTEAPYAFRSEYANNLAASSVVISTITASSISVSNTFKMPVVTNLPATPSSIGMLYYRTSDNTVHVSTGTAFNAWRQLNWQP
ncbi:MAG: hypothetical protein A2219_07825 [Elusimicrobia bacterium RIFOXYA2_FULL_50_26]|nr:MAG: hypothetical protein A2219_07825 [Elusimicrobia bacterium RIFOXYA2_FULL_50_26]OGS22351.1 MAG: hypothetical protein A2314_08225 [Elusimicrobia bacterium RIFOXYB2_FULL_50_12]